MGSVLVSKELEEIVDKDNILGSNTFANCSIVTVKNKTHSVQCMLQSLSSREHRTKIKMIVGLDSIDDIFKFLNNSEKSIVVGKDITLFLNSKNQIEYSIDLKKDMYIWKIIIDNCE